MIKKVLKMLCEGKTLAEISELMGMEYSALIGMLEHMVKMGYLVRGKKQDMGKCSSCPLRKVCSQRNYVVYYLTEKGKKLASC